MWEFLLGLLSSSATPWIVGIITTVVTGWWALKKVRYEKRLEKFKETNANLFTDKKQEVLAAIATLSIFKRDPEFEKNTIDVLLSRLYTELDYDIINSILSTLIQDSNREELLYIADGLQDINRNFFVQEYPMKQRVKDVNDAVQKMDLTVLYYQEADKKDPTLINSYDPEIFILNKNEAIGQYYKDFSELIAGHKYKLKWHKQVTADAYAMFLRKAYLKNKASELSVRLFQNDFNYVYMAEVIMTNASISRSALSSATFAEVNFNNIDFKRNDFFASRFYQCKFVNGIISESFFERNEFEDVVFENIVFEKTNFLDSIFKEIKFINCTGLVQNNFSENRCLEGVCIFPAGVTVESNEDYNKRKEKERYQETATTK